MYRSNEAHAEAGKNLKRTYKRFYEDKPEPQEDRGHETPGHEAAETKTVKKAEKTVAKKRL